MRAMASLFLPLMRRPYLCFELVNSCLKCRSSATILPATNSSTFFLNNNISNNIKGFHTTTRDLGIDEFFDDPKNRGKQKIKSGMAWSKDLLRRKSIVDLQRLWFLLLKERNMLNTLELYCLNHDEAMPGADRLDKVAESMSNLRDVIEEREKSINMLQHGTPDKIGENFTQTVSNNQQTVMDQVASPGEWRKNALGKTYFYKYKEHLIPRELQMNFGSDLPADMAYFTPKLEEWHLRMEERRQKKRGGFYHLVRQKYSQIRSRNPHLPQKMPQWFKDKFKTKWRYGIHPQMTIFMNHKDKDSRIITTRPKRY